MAATLDYVWCFLFNYIFRSRDKEEEEEEEEEEEDDVFSASLTSCPSLTQCIMFSRFFVRSYKYFGLDLILFGTQVMTWFIAFPK